MRNSLRREKNEDPKKNQNAQVLKEKKIYLFMFKHHVFILKKELIKLFSDTFMPFPYLKRKHLNYVNIINMNNKSTFKGR